MKNVRYELLSVIENHNHIEDRPKYVMRKKVYNNTYPILYDMIETIVELNIFEEYWFWTSRKI